MKIYTDIFQPIEYTRIDFSGGEVQVKLAHHYSWLNETKYIVIEANLFNSQSVMELFMLTDAIRRQHSAPIRLVIPYLPYARQDRVCAPGEALSLKVMCDLINSQNYDSVEVWDVHSDVSLALLKNVKNIAQEKFLYFISKKNMVLVAPDAGALKKVGSVAKAYKMPMVRADKIRNVETGEITETVVYSEHIGDRNFLILDDILDGGATYIHLAEKLKPLTNGKINLYVTHGIFSKGIDCLVDAGISQIYTANPFPNVDLSHPNLTVINMKAQGH